MGRVSRAESAARTRERLLQAAAEVFAEKGFAGASVDEIAERAGHTKGAVYSNFANKDDLFLALIDDHLAAKVVDLDARLGEASDPAELVEGLHPTVVMPNHGDRTTYLLFSEFRLYALRHPEVARRLADHERSTLAVFEKQVELTLQQLGIEPPVPTARLAAVLQVLGAGLELFHHLDPEGPTKTSLADALAVVLAAADPP